jgi:hypothetical protein
LVKKQTRKLGDELSKDTGWDGAVAKWSRVGRFDAVRKKILEPHRVSLALKNNSLNRMGRQSLFGGGAPSRRDPPLPPVGAMRQVVYHSGKGGRDLVKLDAERAFSLQVIIHKIVYLELVGNKYPSILSAVHIYINYISHRCGCSLRLEPTTQTAHWTTKQLSSDTLACVYEHNSGVLKATRT